MRIWRLTTRRFADSAFSGVGNREVGSRWVPKGQLAVYASEHLSTAVLETLVHMEPAHFGNNFVYCSALIPDELPMDEVSYDGLPDDWQARNDDAQLQQVGLDWIDRASSAILIVPSAVVPYERNIIINPAHRDFDSIKIDTMKPFVFDHRLQR